MLCTHKIGYKLWMKDHLVVFTCAWWALDFRHLESKVAFIAFKPLRNAHWRHSNHMYGLFTAEVYYTASYLLKSLNTFRNFEVVWKIWLSWTLSSQHPANTTGPFNRCREAYRAFWVLICKEQPAFLRAWWCDPLERKRRRRGAGSLGSCTVCPAVGVFW